MPKILYRANFSFSHFASLWILFNFERVVVLCLVNYHTDLFHCILYFSKFFFYFIGVNFLSYFSTTLISTDSSFRRVNLSLLMETMWKLFFPKFAGNLSSKLPMKVNRNVFSFSDRFQFFISLWCYGVLLITGYFRRLLIAAPYNNGEIVIDSSLFRSSFY